MDEIDIWRAAEQMRKMFGRDAAIHSANRADKMMELGDGEGYTAWMRITAAINELDRQMPHYGEAKH